MCGGKCVSIHEYHKKRNKTMSNIKNTEGSVPIAIGIGSLVVRLKYGLYVGHLSKWFVLVLMFNL
ncbi:MAG: hypothetical protein DYG99_00290 [Bacteroidetes bacterium CHB5]|nr:hypothetical protein [Bacteroidetes bacterium CHB5]